MREILYQNFKQLCLFVALVTGAVAMQAQPISTPQSAQSEDFNGCTQPTGWTTNVIVGAEDWRFDLPGFAGGSLNGTCAATFDDDAAGNGQTNHAELISPVVDVSTWDQLNLDFDYNNEVLGLHFFRVSVWDGSAWVQVFEDDNDSPAGLGGQVSVSLDVTAYINTDFQVKYEYLDLGAWSYGVGVDNHDINGERLFQYNLRVTNELVEEYTQNPISQIQNRPFTATVVNLGWDTCTNVIVTTTVTDGITTFSESSAPQVMARGDTFIFDYPNGGFDAPNTGLWTVTSEVTLAEPDGFLPDNETAPVDYNTVDRVYARDDANPINAYGINPGFGGGAFGNVFQVFNETFIEGGVIDHGFPGFSGGPVIGSEYELSLYEFNDVDTSVGALITQVTFPILFDNYRQDFQIAFDSAVTLQPGKYLLAVEQDDQDPPIFITVSNDLNFPVNHWFANPLGAWTTFENSIFAPFAGNLPMVRGDFGDDCMLVNAGLDTVVCGGEPVTLGGNPTADLGFAPYTYTWSPTTGLNDPASANPITRLDETTTYTLTVEDDSGCVISKTVTIFVNPVDSVAVLLPTTDYCIDDDPDTVDFQPFTGLFPEGPGLVVADSGAPAGVSGFIETITDGGNGGNVGGMVYFTVDNTSGFDIRLTSIGMNIDQGSDVLIYLVPGGHAGQETNAGAWTLVGTADGNTGPFSGPFPGNGTITPCPVQGTVSIPPGVWGVALETPNAAHNYTNGNGANQFFSNADLSLDLGSASNTPFGAPFTPRVWNGNLEYEVGSGTGTPPVVLFDPSLAGVGTHLITYCIVNQFECERCDTFEVTVHDLPNIQIDAELPICSNETIFLNATPALGTWSGAGIVDPQSGEFDGSVVGPGMHTVYYELVDENGCYNIDSLTIEVYDIPTADAGADLSVCEGEGIVIGGNPTFTPGSDPVNGFLDNYSWSPATGLSSSVDPNPVASPAQTTTYIVTVQDNNGCIDSDTMTVTVLEAPVADAGADAFSCNGTPVVIGGTPSAMMGTAPYTYSWAPATGLSDAAIANPMATPTMTTEYTLTVTDANGCQDEATVVVNVVNGPVADAGNDVSVCSGIDVTLGGAPTGNGGTPPYSYSWAPAGNLNSASAANPVFNAMNMNALPVPYSFTVTVTDANGCTATDVVNITVEPGVIVDAGMDQEICSGDDVTLGGGAVATNGVPPYTYDWKPNVGLTTPNVAKPTVTPTSSTIYTVTVTDDRGCVGTDEVLVTVNPLPLAEAGPDQTICKGTTTNIGGLPTANNGTAPYIYSWSPYIGLNDDSTANPIAGPAMTTTFTLNVVDSKGCKDVDVVTVFVVENPVAAAGVDKDICIGESIEIGARPAASNGTAPYLYKWTPASSLDSDVAENPIASPTVTTEYVLTVYDANNCMDVDSMVVTVNPLPQPTIDNIEDNYCIYDDIIVLQGSPVGGVFEGNGISGSTFIPALAGVGVHEIKYTYTDDNGCTNSVSYIVNVHPRPIIYAGDDQTIYLGESTVMTATSQGDYDYVWTPGDYLDNTAILNPDVLEPLMTTTYTLTATDDFGCENSDEVTIFVDVNTPLNPPNVFSPNGDGINDTWIIPTLDFFPDNNVKVYNRWGKLVYEQQNYTSGDAWDGSDLPEGTYFYVISLDVQGETVHRGAVTIVR